MRTSFEYLYRDAANYKVFEAVVLWGALRLEELTPFLHEGEFFNPSQIGLKDLHCQPKLSILPIGTRYH